MQAGTTLTQFMIQNSRTAQSEPSDLVSLMHDLAIACKQTSDLVRRGELAGVLGSAGSENIQGEEQKKLDQIANDVFIAATEYSGQLAGMASEEMDNHYAIPKQYPRGKYLLTFDPLDGSSNIDVNGATGTIFSITQHDDSAAPSDESFLQTGRKQVCAGYCLYSSATMLVITTGNGVAGFTLDNSVGEFILSHPNMTVPKDTNEFAINAAYTAHWHAPIKRYIDECIAGTAGPRGKAFNMRWAGSMVGDIHRILCRGGIFLYPSDSKMEAAGKTGKLRLLYEANPMGMLIEQAGGAAHTGVIPILDIEPENLHQRVPVIMGSIHEVERVVNYHQS